MTCNNVILAQPEAGTSVNYEIPQAESARLTFGPEDISGLSLNPEGGLVINFVKGGALTITNFGDMAANDNMLFLSDGTMVDPELLKAGLERSMTVAGAGDNDIVIGKPADGVINQVTLEPGKDYIFGFTQTDPVKSYMQDGQFIMTFANGGEIVLSNYQEAMAADNAPTLSMDTRVCELTNGDLIAALTSDAPAVVAIEPAAGEDVQEVAKVEKEQTSVRKTKIQNVADIEPAAGDDGVANIEPAAGEAQGPLGNTGFGFGSAPGSDPFAGPNAVGPLDPTALLYNAPVFEQNSVIISAAPTPLGPLNSNPIAGAPSNTLDETNLGPLVGTGTVVINFGNDGPGSIAPNGSFTPGGSLKGGTLSSCGVPVVVTQVQGGYQGVANGQTVFTLQINPLTGNYTYTQFMPLDHADATNPNDAINLVFGIVATDSDGDSVQTQITITVLDDAPIANDDSNAAAESQTVFGNVVSNDVLSKDDKNTVTKVSFNGTEYTVPAVGFVTVPGQYGTLKLYANGNYEYTANANNPSGIDAFTYTLSDCDLDTDPAVLRITVTPRDDQPILVQPETWTIDETNLGPINLAGDLNANFGTDGPGTFAGTNTFTSTGSKTGGNLTHNGVPVVVTFDSVTGTYTGKAGLVTIFTMKVESDGDYQFSLLENLDHADGTNPNDIIELNFGVKAIDADGDEATGVINIKVKDDVPTITTDFEQVDETNLTAGPLSLTDTVPHDFGEDGPGDIKPNGDFVAKFEMNGPNVALTSGGQQIVITQTANGYVGKVGNTTIFDLVVNPATGQYTYRQFDNIDHPNGADPDDVIWLKFGVTITDWDGDTATAYIGIDVHDDGPVANNDTLNATESQTVNGNVVTNDTLSTDAPNTVTQVVFNGTTYNVPAVGTVNVPGQYGTLTIASTGVYSYTANNNNPNGVDVYTYTLRDGDGDTDTATLSITVSPIDDRPIVVNGYNVVDETNMAPNTTVSGTVNVNYGGDGPGTVTGINTFSSSGSQLNGALTSNGQPVTVSYNAVTGVYTGTAGGQTVFTLTVSPNGNYAFNLLKTLDHADPTDPNDIINLNFGIKATDSDGDITNGLITIAVKDDVPTIGDSFGQIDETNLTLGPQVYSDTVVTNFGQDVGSIAPNGTVGTSAGGAPLPLTSGGQPVVITQTANGWVGKVGTTDIFTMTINPTTGKYTYTQLEQIDHPNTNDPNDLVRLTFPIRVTSVDGDTDTGTITIDVADDAPVAENDINSAEEGQTITGNVTTNDNFSEDSPNTVSQVVFNGTTYTVPANGQTVITGAYGTLTMNSNGTYSYAANNNDPDGTDVFTYTLKDRDGDTEPATLTIRVTPDGSPVAVSELLAVDETNLTPGPMIFNGNLNADFGRDGGGTITPTGLVTKGGSLLGGNLTSGGQPVVVTQTATGYEGKVGTTTVFTLDLNNNGTYRFQLFDHIDHANPTDPNDTIVLNFGVRLTDIDGDTADGLVTIHIHDDAPVAYDDGVRPVNENQAVNGNILTNDEKSEDRPTNVIQVTFNGTNYNVPTTGTVNVPGQFGTLVIGANGAYTYTANGNNPNGTDTFSYTIRDYDGDTDTAEFSFLVSPVDDRPVIVNGFNQVDETGGFDTVSGTVTVNYGGDAPGSVTPLNTFTSSYALTSNGQPVTVSLSGNTYTGTAGGQPVFTLTVNANGTYSFTQIRQLDHANASDPNDSVDLVFGIRATDGDGDTGDGNITIRVFDDGPQAVNDTAGASEGGAAVTGNVLTNDAVGLDTGASVRSVTYNGTVYNIAAGGSTTINAAGGTLVLNSTGAYTFTPKAEGNLNANVTDVFSYTMQDRDGDVSSANLSVTTSATDDRPVIVNGFNQVDETGGFDTVSGTLQINTGNDSLANVTGTQGFSSSYPLTWNGQAVQVYYDAANNRYEGVVPNVVHVFTLQLASNGNYTFIERAKLDHANASDPNDSVDLVFGVRATDSDGDTGDGSITIRVFDDGPSIGAANNAVDETYGAYWVYGNTPVNFGADGSGQVTGNGWFAPSYALTSQGQGVSVGLVNHDTTWQYYQGTRSDGAVVFQLWVNKSNGAYQFAAFHPIDHANAGDPNDFITLNFGVRVTDADRDTADNVISINVYDDGPQAVNDVLNVGGNSSSSINLLSNDGSGFDGGARVTYVWIAGQQQGVPAGGTASFALTDPVYGIPVWVSVHSNGTASIAWDPARLPSGVPTAFSLTYQIADIDGDTSAATATFNLTGTYVEPPPPPSGGDGGADGGGGDGCPLVFDLDRDGIELIAKQDGVLFDIDEDGIKDQTAWLSGDDAFLVWDKNEDGVVNDHSEMFGNDVIGGYQMLSLYDSNADGKIDAQDTVWTKLTLWQDLNGDAISQVDEFLTLDQAGFLSISLATFGFNQTIAGNFVGESAEVTMADGTTLTGYDAWFQYDSGTSQNTINISGDGSYYGTDDADRFIFEAIGDGISSIQDFRMDEGDILDLSLLLDGQDDVTEAINSFVYATEVNGGTVISVDLSGSGDRSNALDLARIEGVTGVDINELIKDGNLVA
ncbi:MAG: tandem-95 repeat protein [Alphaproteobacteria bacterium]|nr:tandem-95 repeat protein [Alphaproteobacteria bacterium]